MPVDISAFAKRIINDAISGDIFGDTYFDTIQSEYNSGTIVSLAPTNEPNDNPIDDSITRLRPIVEEAKLHILSKKNLDVLWRPDINNQNQSIEYILPFIIQTILHIYEIELSLFDEKKTHYEIESLRGNLIELSKIFNYLKDTELYKDLLSQDKRDLLNNYIAFIGNKLNQEWTGDESYFPEYSSLIKLERLLTPKEKSVSRTKSTGKEKVKEAIKNYYAQYPFYQNLVNKRANHNLTIDWTKVRMVDLYLYFEYVKNYKYSEKKHLDAYEELKIVYEKYFEEIGSKIPEDNKIEKMIYLTDRLYFSNYLVSTLASAILNDSSFESKSIEEIEKMLLDLTHCIRNNNEPSYFTNHKFARLFLHTAKLYSSKGSKDETNGIDKDTCFKRAEDYLKEVQEFSTRALSMYNMPGGSMQRFYPDFDLIKKSGIFSLTGFCKFHGDDFSARILKLQFDAANISTDFFSQKQHSKTKAIIQEGIRESEKNISRNNIEILGIFSAIVLFVSGNIQIYQYIGSLHSALVFMICFCLSLSFFVLLLRGSEKILLWITGVLLGFFSLYLFLSNDSPQINEVFMDKFKEELFSDLKEKKDMPVNVQKAIENFQSKKN